MLPKASLYPISPGDIYTASAQGMAMSSVPKLTQATPTTLTFEDIRVLHTVWLCLGYSQLNLDFEGINALDPMETFLMGCALKLMIPIGPGIEGCISENSALRVDHYMVLALQCMGAVIYEMREINVSAFLTFQPTRSIIKQARYSCIVRRRGTNNLSM